jgi:hypothetical protein
MLQSFALSSAPSGWRPNAQKMLSRRFYLVLARVYEKTVAKEYRLLPGAVFNALFLGAAAYKPPAERP